MSTPGRCGLLLLTLALSAVSTPAVAGGAIFLRLSPWIGLADDEQTFLSESRKLDSQSSGTGLGLALEWRFSNGFALGFEFLGYSHEYSPPVANPPTMPSNGKAQVGITALTIRKYFGERGGVFYPYVGLGYGTADIDTSHPLFGAPPVYDYVYDEYSTEAFQVSAGLEVRFFPTKKRHLGVVIEAKHMGYGSIEENRYDPTGVGIFVGVGLVRD